MWNDSFKTGNPEIQEPDTGRRWQPAVPDSNKPLELNDKQSLAVWWVCQALGFVRTATVCPGSTIAIVSLVQPQHCRNHVAHFNSNRSARTAYPRRQRMA